MIFIFSNNSDVEHTTLRGLGETGTINDMQASYLRSLGHTGALPDMLKKFHSTPLTVDSQSLEFGTLTKASAGGDTPVSSGETITSASIDSGDASTHWQISSSGELTPTAAGDTADLNLGPYALVCTFNSATGTDTATITITPTVSEYSVSTRAEFEAVIALTAAVYTGSTIKLRDGDFNGDDTPIDVTSETPAAEVTITSYGYVTNADNRLSTRTSTTPGFDFTSSSKFKVQGLIAHRDWVVTDGGTTAVIDIDGTTEVKILDNEISSNSLPTVTMEVNPETLILVGTQSNVATTLTVEDNHIHDGSLGLRMTTHTASIRSNQFVDFYSSFFDFFGPTDDLVLSYNRGIGIWVNPADTGNAHGSLGGFSQTTSPMDGVTSEGNIWCVGDRRVTLGDGTQGSATGNKFNNPAESPLNTSYQNIDFKNNILVCNGSPAIEFSGATNVDCQFNTIVHDDNAFLAAGTLKPAINFSDTGTGVIIANNIITSAGPLSTPGTIDSSIYTNSHNNLTALSALAQTTEGELSMSVLFDGPVTDLTPDNIVTRLNPVVGSRILATTPKTGAVGTGYFNWSTNADSWPVWTKPAPTVATGVTTLDAVQFDGTNDYTVATDAADPLLGIVDDDELTIIAVVNTLSDSSERSLAQAGSNSALRWRILPTTNQVRFSLKNSSSTSIVEFDTGFKMLAGEEAVWTISLKISTYELHVMKNGVLDPFVRVDRWTDDAWDINTGNFTFGARNAGADKTDVDVKAFFFADEVMDLHSTAAIDKIIAQDDNPADWGSDGSTLSSVARVYLKGDATAWNSGSGLNLASATAAHKFNMTGAVEDAGYTPNQVETVTSGGYHEAAGTFASTSSVLTFNLLIDPDTDSGTKYLWHHTGRSAIWMSGTLLQIEIKNTANTVIYKSTLASAFTSGTLNHLHIVADLGGTPTVVVTINGSVQSPTETTAPTTGTIAHNQTIGFMARSGGSSPFPAVISDYYVNYNAAISASSFYSGGVPLDISGVGSPEYRFGGSQTASDWDAYTNLGSGTVIAGVAGFTDV